MPYATNHDLPDSVKNHLPPHAQDIYREAFNHAYAEYHAHPEKKRSPEDSVEEIAHRVAWSAVKNKYEKGEDGYWKLLPGVEEHCHKKHLENDPHS
jgi:cation transport regulator